MDKILLRTRRLRAGGRSSWYRTILARFSDAPATNPPNKEEKLKYQGLDQDPSWEAGILRHEKLLNRLKEEGVAHEDLPELDREEKVKNLPHLAFHGKSKFERNESVTSGAMRMLLGNATRTEVNPEVRETNIDPDFARDDVQEVLGRIHYRCDIEKVFKIYTTERELMPSVKYLTDEQLQKEKRKYEEEITDKIAMPPVMLERQPCSEVLSEDKVLDGYEESRLSFVDVSEGLGERERFIVMREPDGTLRKAEWEERDRLIRTYYAVPGRQVVPASFFDEAVIKNVLEQKIHENALDQCTVQFEPDSKEYIRTFQTIYKDIDKNRLYDTLRSTRYFGGLVFFLAKNLSLDGIILDMLNRDMLDSAADCVLLLTLLHPDCKTKTIVQHLQTTDYVALIKGYIEGDSRDQKTLSLALERLQGQGERDASESTR